jgi:hypothetical protein
MRDDSRVEVDRKADLVKTSYWQGFTADGIVEKLRKPVQFQAVGNLRRDTIHDRGQIF